MINAPDDSAEHAPVLDLDIGLARAGNDRAILYRMLAVYLQEIPKRTDTLRHALEKSDFTKLKALSHSLKSTSAVIGARAVSLDSAELEKAAAAEDRERCRELSIKLTLALVELESRLRDVPGIG